MQLPSKIFLVNQQHKQTRLLNFKVLSTILYETFSLDLKYLTSKAQFSKINLVWMKRLKWMDSKQQLPEAQDFQLSLSNISSHYSWECLHWLVHSCQDILVLKNIFISAEVREIHFHLHWRLTGLRESVTSDYWRESSNSFTKSQTEVNLKCFILATACKAKNSEGNHAFKSTCYNV